MSTVRPDRIPIALRRKGCETIGAMHRAGWDVLSHCQTCGLVMRVSLPVLIRISGPDLSLWNRKERCRRIGCPGFVEFQGKALGMAWHDPLRAPWPD
jgi:hypothetical protein